jgi:methionyl-tRNA formyltransferase
MTNVVVVSQDDPFYVPKFFAEFFPALADDVTVEAVVELDPFDEPFHDLLQRMLALYGPVNFVRQGLRYVTRRVADGIGGRQYSIETVAGEYGIPVHQRSSVNTAGFREYLRDHDVDVVLSVAAPEIFDAETLAEPNWGCLNVHTADLPKYRGMLPTFWALYHDEDEIGVTVHTMTTEVDDGDVVAKTSFPADGSLDDVISAGKRQGGRLAASALQAVHDGTVETRPMTGESSYFSFPSAADRQEFRRRGNRLL